MTATGGASGNPVTFTIDGSGTPGACSISGAVVSFTGIGTCVIDANQAGNASYAAAPRSSRARDRSGNPGDYVHLNAPPSPVVGGSYTVTATGGASGNPVTFTIDGSGTPGACSISGAVVSFTGVGTCIIDASQDGNTDYSAAPQVQQTFTITGSAIPLPQAITFTSTPPPSLVVGGSYTVTATGGASGNPVTFTVDPFSTLGACSISGVVVSFTGVGTCIIDANQAGNANYTAAPQVEQPVTIGQGSQTITFTSAPPANALIGGTYTVTATGGASGNPVTFTIDGSGPRAPARSAGRWCPSPGSAPASSTRARTATPITARVAGAAVVHDHSGCSDADCRGVLGTGEYQLTFTPPSIGGARRSPTSTTRGPVTVG